jgi:hypothetical protein
MEKQPRTVPQLFMFVTGILLPTMALKLNICGAHSALSTPFLNCPTPHRPNRLFYMSDHDDHNCNPSTAVRSLTTPLH